MTPLERLQTAIDKLEQLKAESTPGGWDILDGGDRFIAWHDTAESTGFEYIVAEPVEFECEADADLIVTLHRTIDAQLSVLALGAVMVGPIPDNILALADAINGETP